MSLTAPATADVDRFAEVGLAYPLDGITAAEAGEVLSQIEAIEAARGNRFPDWMNVKPHLLFPFLWDLIRDPRLLAPVQRILGPDLLCWQVNLASKPAGSGGYFSWHQDATYYGLSEPRGATVWLALTAATPENGCMHAVPGSHLKPQTHVRTRDPDNLLPFGEEVAVEVKPGEAVAMALAPGQFSIHHLLAVHGSAPNRTDRRRTGLAIRYIAGDLRQSGEQRGSATLVSGRDHGTFELERAPAAPLDPEARRHHDQVLRRWARLVQPAADAGT